MPLADVSNTEWRGRYKMQDFFERKMPLADVSNTEWRHQVVEVIYRLVQCHLLMLVTPNGGRFMSGVTQGRRAMPLADVSNTEWRQNILLGFRAASHAAC